MRTTVALGIALWLAATTAVLALVPGRLPFYPPSTDVPLLGQVGALEIQVVYALFVSSVAILLTRGRPVPDFTARTSEHSVTLRETAALVAYGMLVLAVGGPLGQAVGGHAIGLHLPGTIYALDDHVTPGFVAAWCAYNFVLFTVVPFAVFRARGYDARSLSLVSADRRRDIVLILVVLAVESSGELIAVSRIGTLAPPQLLVGAPLSFVVHLVGTGLPVMVFVYALLLPRYVRLTGSFAAAGLLGGLTYALIHLTESWTSYASPPAATFSVAAVILQYGGPGLVKSVLTLRTGNAWVHLWAYHAIAPHVTIDTVNLVRIFGVH